MAKALPRQLREKSEGYTSGALHHEGDCKGERKFVDRQSAGEIGEI